MHLSLHWSQIHLWFAPWFWWLWLDFLDGSGYDWGHDFFECLFCRRLPNNIFGFRLGKILVTGPSGAHTEECRLEEANLELILDGTGTFGSVDALLIIELFLDLLNRFFVTRSNSRVTVFRRLPALATQFASERLLLDCAEVFADHHVIIFNFYHGL